MNPRFPPRSRVVEILTFPGAQLLDIAGPLQVFATCNEKLFPIGEAPYNVSVVARRPGHTSTSAGLCLATAPLPPVSSNVDTLIVAGGPGVHAAARDDALLSWLRERAARVRRLASVCTGAFLLAEAGLLDGKRTATHWAHASELARRYPRLRVEPDPIFVEDGGVWTSAGVTAGIDLSLALLDHDLGRDVALAVARHLVVYLQRSGGQAQFSAALTLQASGDRFSALYAWIEEHLADDLSTPVLASRAGMSERSFGRHYAEATGTTPARAVARLRLEAARRLLAEGSMPVKRVASRCGFGSEETMRRAFVRTLAVTPQDYRARFGDSRLLSSSSRRGTTAA